MFSLIAIVLVLTHSLYDVKFIYHFALTYLILVVAANLVPLIVKFFKTK